MSLSHLRPRRQTQNGHRSVLQWQQFSCLICQRSSHHHLTVGSHRCALGWATCHYLAYCLNTNGCADETSFIAPTTGQELTLSLAWALRRSYSCICPRGMAMNDSICMTEAYSVRTAVTINVTHEGKFFSKLSPARSCPRPLTATDCFSFFQRLRIAFLPASRRSTPTSYSRGPRHGPEKQPAAHFTPNN